jgi:hypothetical protein
VTEGRNNLVLRRYRLLDETFFDENKELFENEGELELEYSEPEQYFGKADCMPLPESTADRIAQTCPVWAGRF